MRVTERECGNMRVGERHGVRGSDMERDKGDNEENLKPDSWGEWDRETNRKIMK